MRVWALCILILGSAAARGDDRLVPEQERALRALARGEPMEWVELSPEQATRLFVKAEAALENYRRYHQPHGLCADIWWHDRSRASAYRYEGIGDSACWTGHYLAALALRHQVAPDPRTREDILAVLERFDVLTRVTGTDGYIARYVGPADSAPYREYYRQYGRGEDPKRPGLGRWAYRGAPPHEDLIWLGNSSRDTYDGSLFGLTTVWTHAPDGEARERARQIVERIVDRLIIDDWVIRDAEHGHSTTATPLFKMSWLRLALSINPERFAALAPQYEQALKWLAIMPVQVRSCWHREYFPNNLTFIRLFALCLLEPDPARRRFLQQRLGEAFDGAKEHLNAQFAAFRLFGGDSPDAAARTTLQGMLYDYPSGPRWAQAVDHRGGAEMGVHSDDFTQFALMTHERVPTDFLWQRPPCLSHGSFDLPMEYPGLDLLLPYWIGRAAGAIPAPGTDRPAATQSAAGRE